jgi:hypothetical protein
MVTSLRAVAADVDRGVSGSIANLMVAVHVRIGRGGCRVKQMRRRCRLRASRTAAPMPVLPVSSSEITAGHD